MNASKSGDATCARPRIFPGSRTLRYVLTAIMLVAHQALWQVVAVGADPLFAAPYLSFGTGRHPFAVATGDLNGDARPDFVVTNRADSTVSVFLGNGDGTFGPRTDFRMGSDPIAVVVFSGNQPAGYQSLVWDGRMDSGMRATSGIYFARVVTPERTGVSRVTMIK